MLKVVTFDPTVPIAVNVPLELVALSTINPVSSDELSVHVKSIWLDDTPDAAKFEGAVGVAGGNTP